MQFRTLMNLKEIQKSTKLMDYQSKIGLIGSCFVENIGEKFAYYKFDSFVNPYGILFHPKAIERALTDIIQQRKYSKSDLVFENERWHSMHHHSSFSNEDASLVLEKINQTIKNTYIALKKTSHLIITLGTAWVYQHTKTNQLVANCHKIPATRFIKRKLSVDEISTSLHKIISLVNTLNPKIQIIFTLSPVRHLKDGMLANSLSKANLLTSIHEVVAHSTSFYFPSYEIQLDDLRDYRFFKKDMLHPNQLAIDYIWTFFKQQWVCPKAFKSMEDIASIQRDLLHKPFNSKSEQHQRFLAKIHEKQELIAKNIGITF